VAKIEVPESWAEPLRELMAEVEREAQACRTTLRDLEAVSARIAAAQTAAPKR
jgi:hypothetical protein